MFKKTVLLAAFSIVSFAPLAASTDEIATLKNNLASIAKAKTDCLVEFKYAVTLAQKTDEHFKKTLAENYESCRKQALSLLNTVINSNEFTITLNAVTDLYITEIVNENIHFNDIITDPSAYPLEETIDVILKKASPKLDKDAEQLFNIYYVTTAITRSSQMIMKKLNDKELELLEALAALEAAN